MKLSAPVSDYTLTQDLYPKDIFDPYTEEEVYKAFGIWQEEKENSSVRQNGDNKNEIR